MALFLLICIGVICMTIKIRCYIDECEAWRRKQLK